MCMDAAASDASLLSTEDFIIELFVRVDQKMLDVLKDPRAHLWPGELVTLALLFAIKGVNGVFFGSDFITVTKADGDCLWRPVTKIHLKGKGHLRDETPPPSPDPNPAPGPGPVPTPGSP